MAESLSGRLDRVETAPLAGPAAAEAVEELERIADDLTAELDAQVTPAQQELPGVQPTA